MKERCKRKPKIFEEVLDQLRLQYIESFDKKIKKMNKDYKSKNWNELYQSFHKLKGTGLSYGYGEITDLALAVEEQYGKNQIQNEVLFKKAILDLKKLLQKIKEKPYRKAA